MKAAALVSEQKYLHTPYQPDCEFADGVLTERNVGEEKHSWLQAILTAYLVARRKQWGIEVYTEQRVRIRPGKYMLPDICVVRGGRPAEQVFTTPPLIWIEILS